MKYNDLIKAVPTMGMGELETSIQNNNMCLRAAAMMEVAHRGECNDNAVIALKEAKKDERVFWNQYRICDIAVAVLVIIGEEKYIGNDTRIIRLLELRNA